MYHQIVDCRKDYIQIVMFDILVITALWTTRIEFDNCFKLGFDAPILRIFLSKAFHRQKAFLYKLYFHPSNSIDKDL
ncbi:MULTISPECIES: hypothetical protein [unclassified Commensalibacter]|uniref:hypothetical protein n=1 Tax=unclassified Commensalibacter TaxID=2630218 RepID=UPI0018DB201F|nr:MULTISPECIES: hypothetical protein [unclassified Commensalibacter]MBH9969943.1 hypothetical protein [Commensalibacter sp. M0265]MBH9977161.1 hypothetical protein [Commensalibacter sp. M0266]MBH9992978.1 hypothetical protein [Commensalibacter sp. M0270]MBI0046337.1 hypothetical protein [Commensalibacter sp. M0267]MBI0056143.1 hypothetical protein [Commensalibacter sp. M0268]